MADEHAAVRAERAILFSGHMIDAPNRNTPRFPPALEPKVAAAIAAQLDGTSARSGDTAISSAACGSDILFAEAALTRRADLRIYLPFEEPTFLEKSVNFADGEWPRRFKTVTAQARVFVAPTDLGPLPEGTDPYERTNLWMLNEAQRIAGANLVFICVWNGEEGDGPGGTKHMMDAVRQAGGSVHWIDIRSL
jgi:hypothetical protein